MKIIMLIVFVAVLLLICGYLQLIRTNGSRKVQVLEYDREMFAHRGYHNMEKQIPENFMAAFRAAVEKGYGIELDVHITRDGRLAVFHDDTLERMCGVPGTVESYTLKELKKMHLQNTPERIPELKEVLSLVRGRVPILVELKMPGRSAAVCETTYRELREYPGKYMVQSFNTLGLYWYRRHAPEVLRGQLASDLVSSAKGDPLVLRFLVKNLLVNILGRPDFISYKLKDLPNLSVFLCRHLYHVPTAVWTLRSENALREGRKRYNICIFEKLGENY